MFELMPWTRRKNDSLDLLFNGVFGDRNPTTPAAWAPAVEIEELEDRVLVHAEMPGMDRKEIEIAFQKGVLTITGEKKAAREGKEEDYFFTERRYGSFVREIAVEAEINEEKIGAGYNDGVLSITLPRVKPEGPRKIKIS